MPLNGCEFHLAADKLGEPAGDFDAADVFGYRVVRTGFGN